MAESALDILSRLDIEGYANPYAIPLETLRFWKTRHDEASDREQAYNEAKLKRDIRVLRIAIRNAKAKPQDDGRLTALTKVYQDKQSEYDLIFGASDF